MYRVSISMSLENPALLSNSSPSTMSYDTLSPSISAEAYMSSLILYLASEILLDFGFTAFMPDEFLFISDIHPSSPKKNPSNSSNVEYMFLCLEESESFMALTSPIVIGTNFPFSFFFTNLSSPLRVDASLNASASLLSLNPSCIGVCLEYRSFFVIFVFISSTAVSGRYLNCTFIWSKKPSESSCNLNWDISELLNIPLLLVGRISFILSLYDVLVFPCDLSTDTRFAT